MIFACIYSADPMSVSFSQYYGARDPVSNPVYIYIYIYIPFREVYNL